jgi:hypothetical protein
MPTISAPANRSAKWLSTHPSTRLAQCASSAGIYHWDIEIRFLFGTQFRNDDECAPLAVLIPSSPPVRYMPVAEVPFSISLVLPLALQMSVVIVQRSFPARSETKR